MMIMIMILYCEKQHTGAVIGLRLLCVMHKRTRCIRNATDAVRFRVSFLTSCTIFMESLAT